MKSLILSDIQQGLAPYVLGSATPNRLGIWTYGCSLPLCKGCTSSHTHSGKSFEASVEVLIQLSRAKGRNGMVISGGEPSDQADALQLLLVSYKSMFPESELVLYTGLRWPVFQKRFPELVEICDVLVTGPYIQTLPPTALTGSSNQEVILLTPLAKELFANHEQWPKHRVQVSKTVSGDKLTLVGIPDTSAIQSITMTNTIKHASWQQPVDFKE